MDTITEPETVTGEWTLLQNLKQSQVNGHYYSRTEQGQPEEREKRNNNSNETGETEADRLTDTVQRDRQTDRDRETEKTETNRQ